MSFPQVLRLEVEREALVADGLVQGRVNVLVVGLARRVLIVVHTVVNIDSLRGIIHSKIKDLADCAVIALDPKVSHTNGYLVALAGCVAQITEGEARVGARMFCV